MPEGFLLNDASERQRLVDLSLRLRPTLALAVAVMTVPVMLGIPVYGIAFATPLFVAGALYLALNARVPGARRPELLMLSSFVLGIGGSLLAIWFADGPKEYLFSLPAFPMIGMAAIFSRRVTLTAALVTCLGIILVGVGSYGPQVAEMPPILIWPVTLVMVATLGAMASRNAEHVNRSTAMVDGLTGLLNRVALQTRATELEMHAASSDGRVGLLIADIDHFKRVNDAHGHPAGDAVLVAVAERIRQELGSAGSLFRFGGEEFVVLLQGATDATAIGWAERLRDAVGFMPIDDIPVTVSFGVAVSRPGDGFRYKGLFAAADRALYRAKRTGRDRVCSASEPSRVVREATAVVQRDAVSVDRRVSDVAAPTAVPTAADPGWEVRQRDLAGGNWLVSGAVERAHILDLLERCRRESDLNSLILLVALVVCGFWLEWWGLIPAVLAGLVWSVCVVKLPHVQRPEFATLAGLTMIVLTTIGTAFLADPLVLFGLPMGAFVVFGACAVFNQVGSFIIATVAILATLFTALMIDLAAVAATPFLVAFPLALIAASALLGEALGRTARDHRVAGITDKLTGTLNRAALEARIPQLRQHPGITGAPTSLVLFDIDHFKHVNDAHGHHVGDAVLVEVAYRLRGALRAFDSVYRVGGEEFLVVLLDTPHADAHVIAERARRAVEEELSSGIAVTVSAGIATAPDGELFDYDAAFLLADERLYAAKANGRNQIVGIDGIPDDRGLIAA